MSNTEYVGADTVIPYPTPKINWVSKTELKKMIDDEKGQPDVWDVATIRKLTAKDLIKEKCDEKKCGLCR